MHKLLILKEMNKEQIQLRRLCEKDRVTDFDCGDNDLNDFISTDAPLYYSVRLATSYVLENGESGEILGYFSLAHDRISLTDFPSNSAYNRFRKKFFAQGKMFKSYPALKICRLATSQNCRGEGIGTMIINMIIASYRNDNKAGCRFITVDAYADAIPFYYKIGFSPLSNEDEGSPTRLLYFDLKRIVEN
ncbi:MAG: GNAT family N-acetyltransferase [Bacteroidales bacterium]|nr:GNAT family N-acetyltransferase [Bacteroidales bacterium]